MIKAAQTILILLPTVLAILAAVRLITYEKKSERLLKTLIKENTVSMLEKSITRIKQSGKKEKLSFIQQQNAKLTMMGIEYKFEFLIVIAFVLFVIGLILSKVIFKAGPILMIYLGILCSLSIFAFLNTQIQKRKEALTLEFLEKLRSITSYLSTGNNLFNSIEEVLNTGTSSPVMRREFELVQRSLRAGSCTISEAFERMYQHLLIPQIKTFANTLHVHEVRGGNLIDVMKRQDEFFVTSMQVVNEQQVFVAAMRSQQKIIIGLPTCMVVGAFILSPGFFGNFYSTPIGQILAIVCITMLVAGVYLSRSIMKP